MSLKLFFAPFSKELTAEQIKMRTLIKQLEGDIGIYDKYPHDTYEDDLVRSTYQQIYQAHTVSLGVGAPFNEQNSETFLSIAAKGVVEESLQTSRGYDDYRSAMNALRVGHKYNFNPSFDVYRSPHDDAYTPMEQHLKVNY